MTFHYDIIEHIATFSQKENLTLEVNLISFNGDDHCKLDIRRWDRSKNKMHKGLTMEYYEGRQLMEALKEYFERDADDIQIFTLDQLLDDPNCASETLR